MRFEWDEEKNRTNLQKHGVDFETALHAFNDPNLALRKNRIDEETGEQRWNAIGVASFDDDAAVLLIIVHVYRGTDEEEIIRIISARKANRQRERRLYLQ